MVSLWKKQKISTKEIFQLIILEEYVSVEELLEMIDTQYQINRKSLESEFIFHILKGTVLSKIRRTRLIKMLNFKNHRIIIAK